MSISTKADVVITFFPALFLTVYHANLIHVYKSIIIEGTTLWKLVQPPNDIQDQNTRCYNIILLTVWLYLACMHGDPIYD